MHGQGFGFDIEYVTTNFSKHTLINWNSNGTTNFMWDLHNENIWQILQQYFFFFYKKNLNNEFVINKMTKPILKKKNKSLKTYILGNYILSNK